ncbi:MAG TPA: winged helix-turn-helix transcriptional regulator [Nanoarchaeota archaeon]|nr:winged helix-turn-helix transcriptional regulator [Nanoarchaeota archaeon]
MNGPELLSFVMRAKNRKLILALLEKGPKIPAQIMKETGMYKSHTSRALAELSGEKLVFCRNPGDRAFRFYALTPKGKKILKAASELSRQIQKWQTSI